MLLEPVQDSILKPVLDDLSLASAFLVWCIVVAWLWRSGWRVQRRYLIEATLTPYRRNGFREKFVIRENESYDCKKSG